MNATPPCAGAVPVLSSQEFDQIRRLAYEKFGLELRPGKEQLVSSRLSKLLRKLGCTSFRQYCNYLQADRTGESLVAMIDALTTNHTSFFREPAHFSFLEKTVLPSLAARDRISIWSAACSSGEEPYSIAFCLLKHLPAARPGQIRILATDISTRVLSSAQRGAYPAERFQNISPADLRPFLLRGEDQWRGWFQVKKSVRDSIEFRRVNLMENLSNLGTFPVIFCRNVMIYFDKDTQQNLVHRLTDCLEPGGYLFIGHAESLNRVSHGLEYIQPAVYRKTVSARSAGRLEIRS